MNTHDHAVALDRIETPMQHQIVNRYFQLICIYKNYTVPEYEIQHKKTYQSP